MIFVGDDILQGVDIVPVKGKELDVLALGGDDREFGDGIDHEVTVIIGRIQRDFI